MVITFDFEVTESCGLFNKWWIIYRVFNRWESCFIMLSRVFLTCDRCQVFKEVPTDKRPYWAEYVLGFRVLSDREMKRFPDHKFGQAFTTVKCECTAYLPWLEKRYRLSARTNCHMVVMFLHRSINIMSQRLEMFVLVISCIHCAICHFWYEILEVISANYPNICYADLSKLAVRSSTGRSLIFSTLLTPMTSLSTVQD